MSDEIERYKARAKREKEARKEAEKILEHKSLELYQSNLELKELTKHLENRVQERTQELQVALDEAVKLAQVKSEFLANMSHELRTPLNGVLGMLTLLKNTQLSNKQNKFVSTATNSGELLLALINDVLDFTKLDNDKLDLEHIPFNPVEVIQFTCEPFATEALSKQLELVYLIAPDIPSSLLGDPTRIKQIITNIVANAIKFTEQGEVVVSASFEQGEFIISVSDTGIGMTEEQLDKVLDKFSQANESTTRKFGGTGLGLSICKLLIELMSGMFSISSKEGQGSCFEIRLPLEVEKENVITTLPPDIGEQKVLLIFQQEQLLDHVEELLMHWKFTEIDKAFSFDLATSLLAINQYDLVIVGQKIQLEIYDDVFQVIRSYNPDCQLISYWEAGTAVKSDADHIMLHLPIKQSDLYDSLVLKTDPQKRFGVMQNLSDQADYKGSSVLLVEDNLVNQQVAQELLSLFNCQVTIANNGQEALDLVQFEAFDLILMDIQMPVMDGITATKAIRDLGGTFTNLPIIALTAHNLAGDKEKSIAAGMQDHITKPIEVKELSRVLNIYLTDEFDLINKEEAYIEEYDQEQYPGLAVEEAMERVLGSKDLYIRITKEFSRITKINLTELKEGIEKQDQNTLLRVSHTIKGSAANIAANELSKHAESFEVTVKQSEVFTQEQCTKLQQQLDALEQSAAQVFTSIECYLLDNQ